MTEKYHSLKNKDLRTKTLSSLKTSHQKLKERNICIYIRVCWQNYDLSWIALRKLSTFKYFTLFYFVLFCPSSVCVRT